MKRILPLAVGYFAWVLVPIAIYSISLMYCFGPPHSALECAGEVLGALGARNNIWLVGNVLLGGPLLLFLFRDAGQPQPSNRVLACAGLLLVIDLSAATAGHLALVSAFAHAGMLAALLVRRRSPAAA